MHEYFKLSPMKKLQSKSRKTVKPVHPHSFYTNASPTALEYDFILDGGRSNQLLTLINNTSSPLVLESIQITTNTTIQSPWQTLATQWENVQITQNNNFYSYTLNLNPPISIPPGETKALEYSVANTGNLGPIPSIAMPPQQMAVQLQGQSSLQSVPLTNPNPQSNPHLNTRFTMYHGSWGQYQYNQTMETEYWSDINSLSYGFIGFDENGNVFTLDSWGDQLELPLFSLYQQRLPYLQSSISFGGWTNAGKFMAPVFSQMASNPNTRQTFVKNAAAAVTQIGARGIDIDWEYVESDDVDNVIALLQELRNALPTGARLSTTAPAGIDKIQVFTAQQWQQIANIVDEIRPMCYDYFGGFSAFADFHAPWQLSKNSPNYSTGYDIETTLHTFQQMGVPANKLSLGMPNYARSMIVAESGDYAGLYQPVIGTPQGDFPGANGIYSWNSINNFLTNQPSPLDQLDVAQWQYYDSTHPLCADAKMCLLAGQLPNGQWVVINFLDQTSANARAQQAMQLKLGGVMMWANYLDTLNQTNSIANAVSNGLNNTYNLTKTSVSNNVNALIPYIEKHMRDLNKSFFAEKKYKIFKKLLEAKNDIEKMEIIINNKDKLSEHRNIFKNLISLFLSKQAAEKLFEKPKSLAFAEHLLAVLQEPTATISNKKSSCSSTQNYYTEIFQKKPPILVPTDYQYHPTESYRQNEQKKLR